MVPLREVLLQEVLDRLAALRMQHPLPLMQLPYLSVLRCITSRAVVLQAVGCIRKCTAARLAASHPLRTRAAGGDGAVARGVAAGGARRSSGAAAATSSTPPATALSQRSAMQHVLQEAALQTRQADAGAAIAASQPLRCEQVPLAVMVRGVLLKVALDAAAATLATPDSAYCDASRTTSGGAADAGAGSCIKTLANKCRWW